MCSLKHTHVVQIQYIDRCKAAYGSVSSAVVTATAVAVVAA